MASIAPTRVFRISSGLALLTGILSSALGVLVLTGWYMGKENLIQVHPEFVPMQYNTALGFLTCGISLMLILRNQYKLAAGVALLPVTVGILTLIEYIGGVNLGIDELLMKHYITVETSHPGRMAPNTALCFSITGIALFLKCFLVRKTWLIWLMVTLGSLVVGLAGVAFLGYMAHLESAYGWASMTRMAIHTAAGFVILGIGVLCISSTFTESSSGTVETTQTKSATHSERSIGRYAPYAIGLCFVTLLIVISISIWNHSGTTQYYAALRQSHETKLEIETILTALSDIETAEHRYAVTGDERFLKQFFKADEYLQMKIPMLRKLIGKDSHQRNLLSDLEPLVNERMEWAKGTIRIRTGEGANPAALRIGSKKGQQLTDNAHSIIHNMQLYEDEQITGISQNIAHSVSQTTAAMGAGFALVLAMASLVILRVRRDFIERLSAEKTLREHASTLERFNQLAVGRELRILSLKEEINHLCIETGIAPRFHEASGFIPDSPEDSPGPDKEEVSLDTDTIKDLLCSPVLASVLESFCDAIGIGSTIVDLNGNTLLSVRRQRICCDYHHKRDSMRKHCLGLNQELAQKILQKKTYAIYDCPNGLSDAIAPIRILGVHVSNIIVGQFFRESPQESVYENRAIENGFDVENYMKAVRTVPVITKSSLHSVLQFLKGFSELIVELGFERSRTQQALEQAEKAIEKERQQRAAALNLAEDAQHSRQELQILNEQLNRRNAELDEFAFVASHDLQEPLRKLISFGKLLSLDLGNDLPEKAAKDLSFITDAAQRMQNLVQDLLTLSRTGRAAMKHEEFSLDTCADAALQALSSSIEEAKATIHRDPLPIITGDPTLLTQLYQNLISNAIKFMPPGRLPEIHITAEQHKQRWILGVRDNGLGIKPEYVEMIFVPFKRLHGREEYEGTGIGLAICRKVVERHGGGFCVESEPGEGSHFKFTLSGTLETDEWTGKMAEKPSYCS